MNQSLTKLEQLWKERSQKILRDIKETRSNKSYDNQLKIIQTIRDEINKAIFERTSWLSQHAKKVLADKTLLSQSNDIAMSRILTSDILSELESLTNSIHQPVDRMEQLTIIEANICKLADQNPMTIDKPNKNKTISVSVVPTEELDNLPGHTVPSLDYLPTYHSQTKGSANETRIMHTTVLDPNFSNPISNNPTSNNSNNPNNPTSNTPIPNTQKVKEPAGGGAEQEGGPVLPADLPVPASPPAPVQPHQLLPELHQPAAGVVEQKEETHQPEGLPVPDLHQLQPGQHQPQQDNYSHL